MYCPTCKEYKTEDKIGFKNFNEKYRVKDVRLRFDVVLEACKNCGGYFVTEENKERHLIAMSKALEKEGVFSPLTLTNFIDELSIERPLFAKIMGISDENLMRYEKGIISISNKLVKNCEKIKRDKSFMGKLIEIQKEHLTEKEIAFLQEKLSA